MEKIKYKDLPGCIRLTNGEIEMIFTADVGPRILFYGFRGGENILGEHFDAKVETALGLWKPYGGHRLWIAPENMPNSYAPDNSPVEYEVINDLSIRLIQPTEPVTKTQKEIAVTLNERGSGAKIFHKITNLGEKEFEFAAWALTIMRGGGVCEIPNEPFAAYSAETLLPVRNLSLWSYTDFSDTRWQFSKDFIRLRVDESKPEPQKVGVFNRQGWTAYERENLRFVKHFEFDETARYADMNSNVELYTAGSFVEVETLSPLKIIAPGEAIEHTEKWELFNLNYNDKTA